MAIVQARAGIFDAMPRRIHAMAEHRHQAGRAGPPLTHEQKLIAADLLWRLMDKEGYEKMVDEFEDRIFDPETARKTRPVRRRRQEETGVSIEEACAAFVNEIKSAKLSPVQMYVFWLKTVFHLRPSEIESLTGLSNVSQILIRINEKIATQQNNRNGRGV
jgi:hypothetical protein